MSNEIRPVKELLSMNLDEEEVVDLVMEKLGEKPTTLGGEIRLIFTTIKAYEEVKAERSRANANKLEHKK